VSSDNNDFSQYLIEYTKNATPKSLLSILWDNCRYIFLMFIATLLLTIANLGKGSPTKPSIFGFERCSVASFVWFFTCMILMLWTSFFGYLGLKKKQYAKEHEQNQECIANDNENEGKSQPFIFPKF
jgi:hypothetical protein